MMDTRKAAKVTEMQRVGPLTSCKSDNGANSQTMTLHKRENEMQRHVTASK